MADEYKDNGVTFAGGNARFETGTRTGATNFKINGADLNTLYEDIASGSAATDAVTNFKANGTDLGAIFAGVGTGSNVAFNAGVYNATALVVGGGSYAGLEIRSSGDVWQYVNATGQTQPAGSDTGDWVSNKTGLDITDYQFRVGNRIGSDPSRRNSAISIPTSGFTSWTTFGASGAEWYFATGANISCQFDLEIRDANNTSDTDACDFSLEIAN